MNSINQRLLEMLKAKSCTVFELAKATDLGISTVRRHLESLLAAGQVCVSGTVVVGRGQHMQVYSCTRKPRQLPTPMLNIFDRWELKNGRLADLNRKEGS